MIKPIAELQAALKAAEAELYQINEEVAELIRWRNDAQNDLDQAMRRKNAAMERQVRAMCELDVATQGGK